MAALLPRISSRLVRCRRMAVIPPPEVPKMDLQGHWGIKLAIGYDKLVLVQDRPYGIYVDLRPNAQKC